MPFLKPDGSLDEWHNQRINRQSPPADDWGPRLWRRLHSGARTAASPAERLALVDEITAALPKICGCKNHWATIRAKNPPQVDTAAGFFEWTVDRHNDVRRAKGQTPLPLAEADALYPPPTGIVQSP